MSIIMALFHPRNKLFKRSFFLLIFGILVILYLYSPGTPRSKIFCVEHGSGVNHFILPNRLITKESLFLESLCSEEATHFGPNQRVVSFSLFVKKDGTSNETVVRQRYLKGIRTNLKKIREIYPGWVMRLYTDIPNHPVLPTASDFFVCNVSRFSILDGLKDGMIWRILPILDPTVGIFIVRDLDSVVSTREKSAVRQWLQSDKIFHAMRDHPLHYYPVMGGTWGSRNYALTPEMMPTIKEIFSKKHKANLTDQKILARTLYKRYWNLFLVHDSYHCNRFPQTLPFPEQRDNDDFVGSRVYRDYDSENVAECPVDCRPAYGKNWTYC